MRHKHLEQFLQTVLQDPRLQASLWEAAELGSFLSRLQQLATEHGYALALDDVHTALRTSRQAWRDQGELAAPACLDGWSPFRIHEQHGRVVVEWCYVGGRTFSEPFFGQTIAACLRHPLNRLLRLQTSIETLVEHERSQPGLPPSGFIFHMSRCGSTLVARLLATLPQAIVIAEAEPIDAVLRLPLQEPAPDERRTAWLRAVVGALGRRQNPDDQHFFVKFDSWNILDLPVVRRAFPAVPWIFVHRDPVEVLVSHRRMRGSQMVPGMLEPELFGMSREAALHMPLDTYCARVLGRVCEAAANYAATDNGQLVDYRRLPEQVWTELLDTFGVSYSPAEIDRMRDAARFHAKSPSAAYVDDTLAKQRDATEDLRRLADQLVWPHYERLLARQ